MTEIQPSPPGYRGQDEAPGPNSCSPGSFKYTEHVHHADQQQQQAIGSYVRNTGSPYASHDDFLHKQSGGSTRGSSPGEHQNYGSSRSYRRKSESTGTRRNTPAENDNDTIDGLVETNNQSINKTATTAGYNEVYKKNTPGYKNDSGYSESVGFDSFRLPLTERDDVSPPPTPPVRDASSLKGVCYGPGHEKYPSWPSAPERHPDEDPHNNSTGHIGSHRSKSWTDHTNYPKEKPAQYTRPLAKRPNPAFTQQLKTVMERCEKIPAETFESRGSRGKAVEEEPRLWPRVDREGKPLGDAEYVVPSPPEREQQQPSQTISHAELEAYVRSYQDPQVSRVDIYGGTALTQAGLEEYTRVQHSQQASYAQSEGYHSYVSSVDSTTNTPFLDRLRRDSEAVAQRPAPSWEETSREGRDSVVTTSSGGSASSSETLKWHGSMSDVSVSSGLPARQVSNDRWDRGSMSDVSSVNGVGPVSIQKMENNHDNKWQSTMSDLSTSILSPSKHSRYSSNSGSNNNSSTNNNYNNTNNVNNNANNNNNKWKQDTNNKWQTSMNDRNCKDSSSSTGRMSLPAVISHCASLNDVRQGSSPHEGKWQESSIDEETSDRPKDSSRNWEPSLGVETERYNCVTTTAGPQSPTSRTQLQNSVSSLRSPDEWDPLHGSMSDVSQANLPMHSGSSNNSSKQLIAHSARVQTPQRHHSESVLYLDRERIQRKLYRINSTQSQDTNISTEFSPRRLLESPASPQKQAHLSVAERISELEKQQQLQMRYTYLDPEKRHRVSDPTLKAIQKKALLSFYERHQSSWRSEPQLAQGSVLTAQSPPPQPPPRPRTSSSRRASSASDYASGTWRDKTSRATNASDLPSPKHQHSNSCGSLSMDLLGPVIVGSAISIDDWVPERPPKKPHLRTVYNDRVPSPDLPPPSPPTVTENEVLNCDDPLPPPPPELSDSGSGNNSSGKETPGNGNVEEKKRHRTSQQSERQSTRRSKHGKRSERDDRSAKSLPTGSPSKGSAAKKHHEDVQQQHFVRATSLKHAESDFLMENGVSADLATHRMVATGRSSLRYPSTQKLIVNEISAENVKRISEEKRLSSRPPARLPDLIAQRYTDSGNQIPAPQVPVDSRIIRQESMRVESTRIDVSGLLRNDGTHRFESSSGQRPQPQVPKNSNGSEKNVYAMSPQQHPPRPNYLALSSDNPKNSSKYTESPVNHSYSVGSPVKTGYEASSKFVAEASPQKYHEPPKYVPGYHQRHGETNQRNHYALLPKYNDTVKQKQPQCLTDRYGAVISPGSPPPPPLAPRQNTPGRKSLPPPPRPAPPQALQRSQSKASYLAYRRERGAPDSEGSYKRTMSPTARLEDWQQQQQHSAGSREHDDPVLLRVTPHHPHQVLQQQQHHSHHHQQQHHLHHHHSHHSHPEHHQQQNQQQSTELPQSHSVDALHQRIEERNSVHSSEVMGKLSHELTKKLQATENRSRSESNNNNHIINNINDCNDVPRHGHQDKRQEYEERLSPQSVQVLKDRNRQLERERRKLAASCEPTSQTRLLSGAEASNQGIEDFYRERSATIEMTSRNVELLNRRNALAEKRINGTSSSNSNSSSSSSSTSNISGSFCSGASPMKELRNDGTASNSNSNLRINEIDESKNIELVEKPPAPVTSPPRSPDPFIGSEESSGYSQPVADAEPKRAGSCSSLSSTEPIPTFKSSPRKTHSYCNETLGRSEPIKVFHEIESDEAVIAKSHSTSRRKVSNPSQTENSWTRSNSPRTRSSQTEGPNACIELGTIPAPRSRSSSLSSASKLSSSSSSSLGSPRYSPIESKNSPCVSPQPGIEGLTMVQRSEIVLRVNAATSDASSQTDIFYEDEGIDNSDSMDCQVVPEQRQKLQEEIECEELSRELACQLGPNDKLVPILVPVPEHKKPTDYVSGLFKVEATLQPRPRRPPSLNASKSVVSADSETEDDGKNDTMPSTPTSPLSMSDSSSPLSATSAYFTTSEGKARFLTRYSRDVSEEDISAGSLNSAPLNATTSSNDSFDLKQKKEELVLRLDKKVVVLRAEQEAVREEGEVNEALGARVVTRVCAVARPAEASKYRLHVEEVGKITSLLLGLSGRLARAENALYGMPANHSERKILESKRDKLMDQLEEAKILKSNIDKRSINVSAILAKYLNDDEYADYQHFINMKAKLIMDGREIQDKVKLGEEQLAALKETIN